MRSLFDYKERNVIVSPEALLIPEFEEIYKRDKSKDKAKAIKELSYIYFISDYKSPYISSIAPLLSKEPWLSVRLEKVQSLMGFRVKGLGLSPSTKIFPRL